MGAYWHLSLPLEICINNNEKSMEAFQIKYGADYIFKENEKSSEQVTLRDGFTFTRYIDKNTFVVDNDLFIREFKLLYKELVETYVDMFQDYKMPSILYNEDCRSKLFEGLDRLDLINITDAPDVLKKFSTTDGEYFMSYNGWIPEKVVYEGYPLTIKDDISEMNLVTFFNSYFKIAEYHKEFGQLYCFYEIIIKKLKTKYCLAQYLALMGF